jgi:hypothetical protein
MGVRAFPVMLLLAACAPERSADDGVVVVEGLEDEALPSDELGPPALSPGYLEFGVSAVDQGETVTLSVRGASSGDTIDFLRSPRYGQGGCPGRLGGRCLQLQGPLVQIGSATANAHGDASFSFQMSPAFGLGREIALEAVVTGRSAKTSEPQVRQARANGAAGPYGLGASYRLANMASVSQDAILAHTIVVAETAEVTGFGCHGRASSRRFKAALYDDNNGAPGRLLVESGPAPFQVGINLAPATSPTTVQPGRYWLATVFEQGVETWSNGLEWGNPEWIILQPFGQALPQRWQGGNFYQSPRINCFVRVE